jgi:hypothetical protein
LQSRRNPPPDRPRNRRGIQAKIILTILRKKRLNSAGFRGTAASAHLKISERDREVTGSGNALP